MDLIDRNHFHKRFLEIWEWCGKQGIDTEAFKYVEELINTEFSAQLERKKKKWQITDTYPHNVYCSECHKRFAQTHWTVWEDGSLPRNFCPNCGSDMRGDGDDTQD